MNKTDSCLFYVSEYDLYVHKVTHVIYTPNRRRKVNNDGSLTVANIRLDRSGYPFVSGYSAAKDKRMMVGCYTVVALACVPNLDPEHNTEVDHIDHNPLNSWDPSNLQWRPRRENRADTSRRINTLVLDDDKHAARLLRAREAYHKRKNDAEWMEKRRKQQAEYSGRMYHKNKSLRQLQAAELNEKMAKLDAKTSDNK